MFFWRATKVRSTVVVYYCVILLALIFDTSCNSNGWSLIGFMEVLRGLMEDLNGLMRISCLKVKFVKPPRPLFLAFDCSKSCSGLASRISWLKHSLISSRRCPLWQQSKQIWDGFGEHKRSYWCVTRWHRIHARSRDAHVLRWSCLHIGRVHWINQHLLL